MKATLLLSFVTSLMLIPAFSSAKINDLVKEERAKEVFDKKFKVSRDAQGLVSSVTYRLGVNNFSAEKILEGLIAEIKKINRISKLEKAEFAKQAGHNSSMSANTALTQHEAQVQQVIAEFYQDYELSLAKQEGAEFAHPQRDARVEQLKLSMESIQSDEVVEEFDQVAQSEYWKTFNAKLANILLKIRPEVLAVPNDQRYFFQRELITQAAKVIVTQAAKNIKSVPFLGLLSEIFGQVEEIISEQRMYNQNYLLYILENYKAEIFALTDKEAAGIISSIYQSRLGLMQLLQMKKMAEGDWTSYGWNSFYTQKRTANATLIKFEGLSYDPSATKRISSAFAIVNENGKKKIVNLFDKANMFSSKPALAYDFEKPNKVMITRFLVKLGKMGLGFVPMPDVIKNFANKFADSTYAQQVITEGSLAAYFTIEGHAGLSTYFSRQTLNPFLRQ